MDANPHATELRAEMVRLEAVGDAHGAVLLLVDALARDDGDPRYVAAVQISAECGFLPSHVTHHIIIKANEETLRFRLEIDEDTADYAAVRVIPEGQRAAEAIEQPGQIAELLDAEVRAIIEGKREGDHDQHPGEIAP